MNEDVTVGCGLNFFGVVDCEGRDMPFPPGVGSRGAGGSRGADMPFPPGVGAKGPGSGPGSVLGGPESESFEVITVEKAIDERNVGNRMLRNMGWQEGSVCVTSLAQAVKECTIGDSQSNFGVVHRGLGKKVPVLLNLSKHRDLESEQAWVANSSGSLMRGLRLSQVTATEL